MIDRPSAQEFIRHTNSILTAISRSIEQAAFEKESLFQDSLETMYLSLQRSIFKYKSAAGRLNSQSDFEESIEIIRKALFSVHSDYDTYILKELRVRVSPKSSRVNFQYMHPALLTGSSLSLGTVINLLQESFQAIDRQEPYLLRSDDAPDGDIVEYIHDIIPQQKVAPAHFGVVDGILTVVAQKSDPKANSRESVEQSVEALLENIEEIIESISLSNCDHRLQKQIKKVHELLKSRENIIQLGIENINSRLMGSALSDELPAVISARIEGLSTGIAMYVAQFEDWQLFVQNAADSVINEKSGPQITQFVESLLDEMKIHQDVIDPSVPRTIRFLSEMVANPKLTSKRVVFAFVRTIENIIIKSFGYITDVFSETFEKSKGKLADRSSTFLVSGLTAIGLVSAAGIMPYASQVKGLEWVESAYHVVREQIVPNLGKY